MTVMAAHTTPDSTDAAASAQHTQVPAPIGAHEAALLRRILSASSFPGATQLLEQVHTLYLAPAVSDANFRIYIQHPETPRAPFSLDGRAQIPGHASARQPDGRLVADLDVWVERGHLRAMHLRWAGDRVPMTLPSAESVVVDTTPAAAATTTTNATPVVASTSFAPSSVPLAAGLRKLALVLGALCALAVIATAFLIGRSGGADLAAARDAGQRAGQQQGTADGAVLGAFQGSTEGALAGRLSTYQPTFDATLAAARAKQRAAAAKAKRDREAAAAAAAATAYTPPSYADNTSCSGYRDARGYWICS